MRLPHFIDQAVKRLLERKGYVRLKGQNTFDLERRRKLLVSLDIDLLVDVGANVGQYALCMRRLGYEGPMISFEPMRLAAEKLQVEASADGQWSVIQKGVSDTDGKAILHVSGNSISSSLLDMAALHEEQAPSSMYVGEENIELTTLDAALADVEASSIWLKIDVQGLEDRVLRGATTTLSRVSCIQLELSLTPLYTSQTTYLPLLLRLEDLGFSLAGVEPGFVSLDNGRLLQMDGLLIRQQQ